MGVYRHNVVVVIKMDACIHGLLIFCVGAYHPDFAVLSWSTCAALAFISVTVSCHHVHIMSVHTCDWTAHANSQLA